MIDGSVIVGRLLFSSLESGIFSLLKGRQIGGNGFKTIGS